MSPAERDPAFETLLEYLQQTRGFDFTAYKRASLMRRVHKRMEAVDVEDFEAYQTYLEVHPQEFAALFTTILINVTAFFREPEAWDYLGQEIIPQILVAKHSSAPIRVWSAGCASGEEAYTLAMVLAEALGREAFQHRVKIYATDVDEEVLTQARHASYSMEVVKPVPDELRDKYFEPVGKSYVFDADLRRAVIFGRHDLIQDAPISRLDLLVCRNTLMYFNAEAQGRIVARFHFALNDDGFLFLGKAEMLLTHANLFTPIDLKHRIFAKVPKVNLRDRMVVLTQAGDTEAADQLGTYVRLREAAFEAAPVAQVVLNHSGIVILANKEARSLFGVDPRDIGRPFKDMELSYRPLEMRSLIERVQRERRTLSVMDVERALPEGGVQHLDVQVIPLQGNGEQLVGVSILFQDVTQYHQLEEELVRSRQDRETAYEELQSANEELETTNEELQSTVEELQTTNEELQSTNEEMETMNEELQSTNEEMQAVNDELRRRSLELDQSNSFLESILFSVNVGVVALNRDFQVLLWNRRAKDLWGLQPEEVAGRSFLSLDIGLPVEKLKTPIRDLQEGRSDRKDMMLDAINRLGKQIKVRITASPHFDLQGKPQGVVLLMEEEKC
jgi:two-component system CheB/CheR fusion protein